MSRIFLLEDDLSLINGLSFAFKKQGFELEIARTMKEADDLWAKGTYDLVILDVTLPDGSGFDLCRKIRLTSKTPIMFLTAADEESDIIMGLDMGGDDYITKPFKLAVFLSRVHALLRRSENFNSEITELNVNDIKVKLLQGEVYKKGELLDLTVSEYKLLCLFLKNPDTVLSPEQILRKLWDCDENYVDSNSLTVYIRRLRKKIEDDPGEPKDQTAFGEYLIMHFGLCSGFGVLIECSDEGELYRLFHEVNSLVSILNAHAENEKNAKKFLRDTISDISHQLKTPLAAHNIYNGIMQEEKEIVLWGSEETTLLCDRNWLIEAVSNLVKNGLDHTGKGNVIRIEWKAFASVIQITVRNDGNGIYPEDLPHIFKRFYRSRCSKDTQGIGLGLPLAKAIVEAHNGTIECGGGIPLGRFLHIRLITNYFGTPWKFPALLFGIVAVFVFASAVAAVYVPVRRICSMAITETLVEL